MLWHGLHWKKCVECLRINMNKQLDNKTIELVSNFVVAMRELSNHWHELSDEQNEILEKGYPFKRCFNEMSADADVWLENIINVNNINN